MSKGEIMMTINEYKKKHGLSVTQLADLLDVSDVSVRSYLAGNPTSRSISSRMLKFGIEHPVNVREASRVKSPNSVNMKKKEKKLDSFLKPYQLEVIKNLGNTIVSKKHTISEIVEEFERFGLKVNVRNFINTHQMEGCRDTHYVVELKKEGEL